MSVSGFHHHFRAVSATSPLQFQKRIRLQEARRLLLGEDLDVASAGHRVGYSDASQFTREYKRLFGAPPMRDVERLREAAMESAPPVTRSEACARRLVLRQSAGLIHRSAWKENSQKLAKKFPKGMPLVSASLAHVDGML
jgi:AraC-like DNA-binding protein